MITLQPWQQEMLKTLDIKNETPNPLSDPERDWSEDFKLENGNYTCNCIKCGHDFVGYKRRCICKKCSNKPIKIKDSGDDILNYDSGRLQVNGNNFPI